MRSSRFEMSPVALGSDGRGERPATTSPWIVSLLGMCLLAGCGRDDGRVPVDGSVSVDDVPIDGAAINFRPADGTEGWTSGGPVQAGEFHIPVENGLLPGTYDVTVVFMKETGRIINDPQKGPTPELVQVRFREPPQRVTITADGANEFEFKLASAP